MDCPEKMLLELVADGYLFEDIDKLRALHKKLDWLCDECKAIGVCKIQNPEKHTEVNQQALNKA